MKKSHYDFQSLLTSIFSPVVDLYLILNKERKREQHFQPKDGLVISASSKYTCMFVVQLLLLLLTLA